MAFGYPRPSVTFVNLGFMLVGALLVFTQHGDARIDAADLRVGDVLLTDNGQTVLVEHVTRYSVAIQTASCSIMSSAGIGGQVGVSEREMHSGSVKR